MGKRTEQFKKERIESIATIRAEFIEDKKNVQKLAEFQKTALEVFTRKTQQALADFTANTQTMLARCDEVSRAIDAKVETLEREMESIRTEQLTEKHFEGEYNTLKEQVEGMYASVRMFQKPVEESNEEKSTIKDLTVEVGETETETVASTDENSEDISEVDEKTEVTEPELEQLSNDTMEVNETEGKKNIDNAVDDEEFDRMYEDILDTTEKSIDTDTQSRNNTTIQVVESTVTTEEQEVVPTKPDAPASIAELLNRASKINI